MVNNTTVKHDTCHGTFLRKTEKHEEKMMQHKNVKIQYFVKL